MFTSHAAVTTQVPARYAKQLAAHFAHKAQVDTIPDGSRIQLRDGAVEVLVGDGRLILNASAADAAALAAVQDVIARHLVRFGQRADLEVSWHVAAITRGMEA